ncbi:hypothetical protein VMCG_01351 [Cytospora schulzeri]|uniref:Alpha 1,4-glycosyltransferase domain-containing protein n=1 Tax=Cytospora schulzeri TaxID=448051 RepID=A0A423X6U1_9PEZI|nr:hypothetical protein VMCG_01351 [Valsa malicola]
MAVRWRHYSARITFISCALLFLVYHFCIWNIKHQEPHEIPKKIWYKLGPRGLNDEIRGWTGTCIKQNPQYHVEFLTDQSADDFVRDRFTYRPDIVDTYLALTVPIIKADLLRYLLLYAEGGVWFDLDVSCEGIPIDEWIPKEFNEDANLVVGWEFDVGYDFVLRRQFVTWTILAKKGVEHLMAVVNDIVELIGEVAEAYNVTVAELNMDMVGDIVEFTGPRRFKRSVLKSLKRSLDRKGGWKEYHEILEPKMVGDVVILPGYALAAEVNMYEEQDLDRLGPSLVTHHYAGTWKNRYGGEMVEEESKQI